MTYISRAAEHPLSIDSIHIWVSYTQQSEVRLATCQAVLSNDEAVRAQRYYFSTDKNRFILARGGLRLLIAGYLDIAPQAIVFSYNEYQKPFLHADQQSTMPLYFNLSHSHNCIVYAFGYTPMLGVDIEYMQTSRDLDALAQRCFTAHELQQYQASSEPMKTFYKLWAHKEAYLKAIGTGLSSSLQDFDITLGIDRSQLTLRKQESDEAWYACELDIDEAYQAALVCQPPPAEVKLLQTND